MMFVLEPTNAAGTSSARQPSLISKNDAASALLCSYSATTKESRFFLQFFYRSSKVIKGDMIYLKVQLLALPLDHHL